MYIVTANEMYDIDELSIKEMNMEGKLLMENAGRAIAQEVEGLTSSKGTICILVGPGSNGGDGFVIGRTLLNKSYSVQVVQVVPNDKIIGDALYHKNLYVNCGGEVTLMKETENISTYLNDAEIFIDAILGIGVKGMLREPIANLVSILNEKASCVVSVDIPSGLPADEGIHDFAAVQADYTFTVGAPKMSAFLQHTAAYYGEWTNLDIGLPLKAFNASDREVWDEVQFLKTMPSRQLNDHKGDHGRGLVIGGSSEMPGAFAMTLQAALRTGAGLITGATSEKVRSAIAGQNLEATYQILPEVNGALTNKKSIDLDAYDAVAIGIGMGRDPETELLVKTILHQAECPIIIDGDGLFHIKDDLSALQGKQEPVIITPHPGEMAMLMGLSVKELMHNPFYYSRNFAMEHGVYVILKGTHTIISSPEGRQVVNTTGNPGLAKGGSGDVLTGMVLAMIMQGQSIFEGLCNGCYLHGKSADLAVSTNHTVHDLLATDVITGIPKAFKSLLNN
ncbi:NAD(P)H-hydrate epimerase [Virgibacillus halodenitrificans]|uniref:Bifunctional NAD(P)H-hydrate repair enzyme n=1 Tax=Virgibacillus halodenitrificans TaxID=1482 RepID=A0AAC9IXT2_VIRHA|nr:NAD(P)H-hydrate dehydratase [Virgibacillus halodenitrificans]APC47100.1 NAD(P)H-hydrate epimerase [Virgibacillus halodenitrificans]